MIIQDEHINSINWDVVILHNITCDDRTSIKKYLNLVQCPDYIIDGAFNTLDTCRLNIGVTYSNTAIKKSIIIVSKSTSKEEYVNTITHEIYHLLSQIRRSGDYEEEQLAVICGDLNAKIYNFLKFFT